MAARYPLLILTAVAGAALAQLDTDSPRDVRTEFLTAYENARSGSQRAVDDSPALRAYPLYPYVEAARLVNALGSVSDEPSPVDNAIEIFLTRHAGEPVTENVRVAWLRNLAEREHWQRFLEHYVDEVADTALRCQFFRARIADDDPEGIAARMLDTWLTPYQLPRECEPVFEWMRSTGLLDDAMTAARTELLLENGQTAFARIIARRLPDELSRPLLVWADVIEQPQAMIEAHLVEPPAEIDEPMLLDGWSRLARDNPSAALPLYDDLMRTLSLDTDSASEFTRALALGLAWDRRPEALEYFARIPERDVDDYTLEWQTRAALWAQEWELARDSIARMSAELRATAQWRYWAARTSDDRRERNRLFTSLIPHDNYFSATAAAHLRDRPQTHPSPHARNGETLARLASNPYVARARELWLLDLPLSAAREWQHAYASMTPDERSQSVHLAMAFEWFDLAVATATERGIFFDYSLLYPQPYLDEVEAAADEFDLAPSLIYAVMRQESLYRANAESSAGALGLMQLTPATVSDLAGSLGQMPPTRSEILMPPVNIRFGAARLRSVLERYDGNILPALAAYNAGPAAADRWLPDEPLDGDVWLENVPFNETRDYVRRVLWHTVVFESLENDRVNARIWLREVEP